MALAVAVFPLFGAWSRSDDAIHVIYPSRQQQTIPNMIAEIINYSFKELEAISGTENTKLDVATAESQVQPRKSHAVAMHLSNNHFDKITDIPTIVLDPLLMQWIDLSFNNLTRIPAHVFTT